MSGWSATPHAEFRAASAGGAWAPARSSRQRTYEEPEDVDCGSEAPSRTQEGPIRGAAGAHFLVAERVVNQVYACEACVASHAAM